MVRIKDIAEKAGVSTTTVSNVLHNKTKKVSPENVKKINELIKELGYVERKGFRVIRNESIQLIAVIANSHKVYEESLLSDPFYGRTIGFIENRLRELGYYMMFYSSPDIDEIFNMIMTWDVDGIIAVTFSEQDCEKLKHYIQKPIVCIDAHQRISHTLSITNVGIDNRQGGYLMAKHLMDLGYESIHVCTHKDYGNDHMRYEGVLDALHERSNPSAHKVQLDLIGSTYLQREHYYQNLSAHVPTLKKKTAVFFLADFFAMEALCVLHENGIQIPKQIGICGFDGFQFTERMVSPGLTTINQDIYKRAITAVDELVYQLTTDEYEAKNIVLPVTLVSRKSV